MNHDTDLMKQAERATTEAEGWLPPEAPLAMPPQPLTRDESAGLSGWLRTLFGNPAV